MHQKDAEKEQRWDQGGPRNPPEPIQDANGASKRLFGSPLGVPWRSQRPPKRPPRAPHAGPREAKNIDFLKVFHRFRKEVLFGGSGVQKKRDGNAVKVRRRASERPKIEGVADVPFSSNWDPRNHR